MQSATKRPVYLDAHATTPCDPRVVEAMLPVFREDYGNASSMQHAFGWRAEALVEQARERVAALIGAEPVEIVFTSGATESNNLAILGVARAKGEERRAKDETDVEERGCGHIVTSAIEHPAVLDPCRRLEREGWRVTYLEPDAEGLIRAEQVEAAIGAETILVSIMAANNEIGTLNPVGEIGRVCKARGVLFHCDAVQALAYEALDVGEAGIDLLSISAHKMYGPKGVGALYVRRRVPRVRLEPLFEGGGHERGLRPGTLNVPGIVGLGRAAELARAERAADAGRLRPLRDRLRERIVAGTPGAMVNGSLERRLPNNLNVSFAGVDGAALLAGMKELAVSSGAACATARDEPSHVLRALGRSGALARATVRFGLHRFTTAEEIDFAAELTLRTVRALAPRATDSDTGIVNA